MPERNEKGELPIPVEWRSIIYEIVEDIRNRDLRCREVLGCEIKVDPAGVDYIYRNVESYGDLLTRLSSKAWERSCYTWMGGHWELIVDLCTVTEGVSDLALFLDVRDLGKNYCFTVKSAFVP
ncbi:MAG: hypothetical protein CFE27_08335 [Alphaproteobacteria bacterium PA1]|nr:MAG: hypothetical protein CFE27_08335 [Alphaproteobacteria bacterium PA1]